MSAKVLAGSSICIAAGVLLPVLFHMAGGAGAVFLPMHITVLFAGFLLGRRSGFFTGVLTPVLSSMMTGMPPVMPVLPIMAVELAVYGYVSGYLYLQKRSIYAALLTAMVLGRIGAMAAAFLLAGVVDIQLSPVVYVTGAVVTGLPGIGLQLILVPALVLRLKQAIKN